uniref:Uncharacterized protein n=1 Tax=Arundo donax TaxID=35708 RepID=A0A0A9FWX7_ARUDO
MYSYPGLLKWHCYAIPFDQSTYYLSVRFSSCPSIDLLPLRITICS